MTRVAFSFIFSSLDELKDDKCKNLLERLDEIEESIYEKLNVRAMPTSESFANSPMNASHSRGNNQDFSLLSIVLSANQGADRNSKRSGLRLNLTSLPSTLLKSSTMDRTPRLQIDNLKNMSTLGSNTQHKTRHKEALDILAKMKYTLAQLAHFLHYENYGNEMGHIGKPYLN